MDMTEARKEYEAKLERVEKQKEAVQKNRVHSGRVRSGRQASGGSRQNSGQASAGRARRAQHSSGEVLPPSGALAGPKFNPPPQTLHPGYGPPRTEQSTSPAADAHCEDPIGPSVSMRPRTARSKNAAINAMQDDVNDFNADDLLP